MIPASHITFNDDGTAWLIVRKCPEPRGQQSMHTDCNVGMTILDRPCDTCAESGLIGGWMYGEIAPGQTSHVRCPDCIDGRHTFTIEVESLCWFHRAALSEPALLEHEDDHAEPCICSSATYRVSIIPGQVVPIYAHPVAVIGDQIAISAGDPMLGDWKYRAEHVTLPPAVNPGQWAVRLKVHQQGETQ